MLGGFFLVIFLGFSVFAQEDLSSNDIITKMKNDLNLQEDQVTNITPIIEKYTIAFTDLQKSIDDGTINPSVIDSQRQQLRAAEAQEISPYLTANQISQWNYIQGQMDQKNKSDGNLDDDQYSNLPQNNADSN